MPVTAKLSRRFYETFGDEIANELVEWLNSVDATYRADLRELNEVNFSRFDAKLGQRTAELRQEMEGGFARADAKLEQRTAELRQEMEAGFVRADAKLGQRTAELRQEMEAGFARADAKLEQRTAELRQEMVQGFALVRQELTQSVAAVRAEIYSLRGHTDAGFERVRADLATQRAELLKWMFLFWMPTVLALIGLYIKR